MKFIDKSGKEITKETASRSVLAIYDETGTFTETFVNYPKISISELKNMNAHSVVLFTNHAGNEACTKSFSHSHTVAKKVQGLNNALAALTHP
jgi:hypothetical protein